jgi:hypothetical protein
MKRSTLKLKLNRETLSSLDGVGLRAAGGDCTCTACTNCTCCPTCQSCACHTYDYTCWDTCNCPTGRETDCTCI